jgi:hypothetical protein
MAFINIFFFVSFFNMPNSFAALKQLLLTVPPSQLRYYNQASDILLYQKKSGEFVFVHKSKVQILLHENEKNLETLQVTSQNILLRTVEREHRFVPESQYYIFTFDQFQLIRIPATEGLILSPYRNDYYEISYKKKMLYKKSFIGGTLLSIPLNLQGKMHRPLHVFENSTGDFYYTDSNIDNQLGLFFYRLKTKKAELVDKGFNIHICQIKDSFLLIRNEKYAITLKEEKLGEALTLPSDTARLKCADNIALIAQTRQNETYRYKEGSWKKALASLRIDQLFSLNGRDIFAFQTPHLYQIEWGGK